MNVVYDQIVDGKPIPNGIYKKDLIDIYLSNNVRYEYYYPVITPSVMVKKNYIKSSDAENGLYPIGFREPRIINENFLRLMFDYGIDEGTKEKLVEGRLTLVLYLDEEPNTVNHVSVLYDFCKKKKIANFFIYVNIMPIIRDEEKRYRVRYAYRFYDLVRRDIKQGPIARNIDINTDYIFNVFGWFFSNYDFRSAMVYALLKNDLQKNNLISHNNKVVIDTTFTSQVRSVEKICSNLDYTQFKKALDIIPEQAIQYTKLSLAIEAYFDNAYTDGVYLTEKSFRPIYFKKPFLLLGQQDSLKELKNRGFKTFQFALDERYDDMNNDRRFLSVLKQVLAINKLKKDDLHQIIEQCENTVDYNYYHMLHCLKSEIDFLSKQGA